MSGSKKKNKKAVRFQDRTFSVKMAAELLNIPRTTLIEKLPALGIEPLAVAVGASTRKVLTWQDFALIAMHFKPAYIEKNLPKDKVKAVVNQKGGVGKTTLIQQTAMAYALMGMKVLLIDNDPQGHCTIFFGFSNLPGAGPTLKNVYKRESTIEEISIEICPLLHLIPSNPDLSGIEFELTQDLNGTKKLKAIIDEVLYDKYDVILIDNNPAFTRVTYNAMCATDELCFVTETQMYSLSGMQGLFEVLRDLEAADKDFGPGLRIIPNMFSVEEKSSQKAIGLLRTKYSDLVTNTTIHDLADFKNATEDGASLLLPPYRNSRAAHDLRSLANELLLDTDPDQDDEEFTLTNDQPDRPLFQAPSSDSSILIGSRDD